MASARPSARTTEGEHAYVLDWFRTQTAYGRLRAHLNGSRWIGTVQVKRDKPIVIHRGEKPVRDCESEFRFIVHREPKPNSEGELTTVNVVDDGSGSPRTLVLRGTPGPDDVLVTFDPSHGSYVARADDGIAADDRYCHALSSPYSPGVPTTVRCDLAGLRVEAELRSGDDTASLNSDGHAIVAEGGGGNDEIGASVSQASPAAVTISGGGGGDSITTGFGDDTIRGDTGSDEIDAGPGNDVLFGGWGRGPDSLDGNHGDDLLVSRDGRTDGWNYCGPGNDVEVIDDSRTDPHGFNCERTLRPPDRYGFP